MTMQIEEDDDEEKKDDSWLQLPKLEGVKWVYANDWWDRVLAGVMIHNGKKYYAFCVDENYEPKRKWFRRFLVVDLPEEVWKEEDERHQCFVDNVGDHFEFDMERQVRKRSELRPYDLHHIFYDKYQDVKRPDYKTFTKIGWFEIS